MTMRKPSAFTLIELLIVVAIISILASIAMPNFLEAQTRAKVARVKADMRTLATAVESYAVDNTKYPYRHAPIFGGWGAWAPPFNEKIYDPADPYAARGMHVITTPIGYITSLPKDIFNQPATGMAQPGNPYSEVLDYWDSTQCDFFVNFWGTWARAGRGRGWIMMSVGPDLYVGVSPTGMPGNYPAPQPGHLTNTAKFIYDPTNGTVSTGNIYRSQGDLGQADITWM
jgi:prepilin-type N-terminal cleavage/methylation domain-containing protein